MTVVRQVARRGARMYGMATPTIVRFEAEIDAEIAGSECSSVTVDSGYSGDCYERGVADGEERHVADEIDTKTDSCCSNRKQQQQQKQRPRHVIAVDMMSLDEMVRWTS